MRLVDADEFKKQIVGMAIVNNYPADKANKMCELIECQPTAFDLESVVAELEEKALEHAINGQQYGEDGYGIHEREEQAIKQGIEIAIEILTSAANATNGKTGG